MPIIKEVDFNNTSYPESSYTSEWINLVSSAYTTFTVFCSEDCNVKITWAIDDEYQIFDEDSITLTGGTSQELVVATKARFARYSVDNIAITPSDLKIQGFFFIE